ncbi:hypothetical protein BT69DRAFT_224320 [Atractiella rhizophila]|nr:hypothetical protein BT69DRAFT_224320 [Atractiella rhizophila]
MPTPGRTAPSIPPPVAPNVAMAQRQDKRTSGTKKFMFEGALKDLFRFKSRTSTKPLSVAISNAKDDKAKTTPATSPPSLSSVAESAPEASTSKLPPSPYSEQPVPPSPPLPPRPILAPCSIADDNLREEYERVVWRPYLYSLSAADSVWARILNRHFLWSTDSEGKLECSCCYDEVPFEDCTFCEEGKGGEMHAVCRECLRREVEEKIWGEGRKEGDLGCLSAGDGCEGIYGMGEIRRCLGDERCERAEGRGLVDLLEERMWEEELMVFVKEREKEKESVVKCPFCPYVEVATLDELPNTPKSRRTQGGIRNLFPWPFNPEADGEDYLVILIHFLNTAAGIIPLLYITLCFLYLFLLLVHDPKMLNNAIEMLEIDNDSLPKPRGQKNDLSEANSTDPFISPSGAFRCIKTYLDLQADVAMKKWNEQRTARGLPHYVSERVNATTQRRSSRWWGGKRENDRMKVFFQCGGQARHPTLSTTLNSIFCGKRSCLKCQKVHLPGHNCEDSTGLTSLRLFVEKRMTDAVARVCGGCGVSYVKAEGCNKIVCRCGHIMCFVCRQTIGLEGYGHFCQHFRAQGGACTDCSKCDLFKVVDETQLLKGVAEKAEAEWLAAHPNFKDPALTHARHVVPDTRHASTRQKSILHETIQWHFYLFLR